MIEKVFPVFIGKMNAATGEYSNYFASGCHPALPEVAVQSVEAKLRHHMSNQHLGSPLEPDRTVASVVNAITACQGAFVEGAGDDAFEAAAEAIAQMLDDGVKLNDDMSTKGASTTAMSKKGISTKAVSKKGISMKAMSKKGIGMKGNANKGAKGHTKSAKYTPPTDDAVSRALSVKDASVRELAPSTRVTDDSAVTLELQQLREAADQLQRENEHLQEEKRVFILEKEAAEAEDRLTREALSQVHAHSKLEERLQVRVDVRLGRSPFFVVVASHFYPPTDYTLLLIM